MNEQAPISWLIAQITNVIGTQAQSGASGIAGAITPAVAVCFGIYVILITLNYLRGAESEPVMDFALRMAAWAVIIGIGLNADAYANTVIPIVTGLGNDLASAASGSGPDQNALDTLALTYLNIVQAGIAAASGVGDNILVILKAIVVMLGLVPFLVAATVAIVVAIVGSVIVAMVGPLFFAFLLFPATRQYFSAWINTALSYALIPLLVAAVAGLSVGISALLLPPPGSGGTLVNVPFLTVFLAAIGNLVLLFVLRQVSALASSLSAGGINAAMPGGGLMSAARVVRDAGRAGATLATGAGKGLVGLAKGAYIARALLANRSNSIRKAG
jgi:type IV secretion system protein VirB6